MDFGIARILKDYKKIQNNGLWDCEDYEIIQNDGLWNCKDFERLQNISNDDSLGSQKNLWILRDYEGVCRL